MRGRRLGLGRWADAGALGWYLLLTVVFLWPLLTHLDTAAPHLRRDPVLQATILYDLAQNLAHLHLFHLFSGTFYYPASDVLLLSDAQLGLQPVALPLELLTRDAFVTEGLLVVATFPVTAICADALGRLFTRSRLAGLVAGTIFAFAAYRFTHIVHLNLLSTWTLPLSFYCLERALRGGRWRWGIAWGASIVLAASLALHYALFLVLLEPLYVGARWLIEKDRRAFFRRLVRLIPPAIVAGGLALVIVLPYVRLAEQGYERNLFETWEFSARLRDYITPASDARLMHALFAATAPLSGPDERELSPGLIALGLAVVGLVYAAVRGRLAWLRAAAPWMLVVLVAGILSLGPALWPDTATAPAGSYPKLPYYLLAQILPLSSLRSPARFGVVVLLGVAMLAALTVAQVERRLAVRAGSAEAQPVDEPGVASADVEPSIDRPESTTLPPAGRRWSGRLRSALPRALLVVVLAGGLAAEYSVRIPMVPVEWGPNMPAVYAWLKDAPAGPVAELPTNEVAAATYALYSTYDGHPRINGWSGFTPEISLSANPSEVTADRLSSWLDRCRTLGARYVVLHADHVDARVAAAVEEAARAGRLEKVATFGPDEVFVFR